MPSSHTAGVAHALLGHSIAVQHLRPEWPLFVPPGYKDLAEACWDHDAEKRCNGEEAQGWHHIPASLLMPGLLLCFLIMHQSTRHGTRQAPRACTPSPQAPKPTSTSPLAPCSARAAQAVLQVGAGGAAVPAPEAALPHLAAGPWAHNEGQGLLPPASLKARQGQRQCLPDQP